KRYWELATAFTYRKKIPGCTCNGRDAFGLVNTAVADDPTLRPGDIVATNAGLMAYSGGPNGSTFTPISSYAGLSADLRRQLTETKVEQPAEGPELLPPLRPAEAPPAPSTPNKRAQGHREGIGSFSLQGSQVWPRCYQKCLRLSDANWLITPALITRSPRAKTKLPHWKSCGLGQTSCGGKPRSFVTGPFSLSARFATTWRSARS